VNVGFRKTAGDSVYLFNRPLRPLISGCRFEDGARCHIHAQTFQDAIITGCHFSHSMANNHIKAEADNEGIFGRSISISACAFEGDADSVGIQLGGLSDTTPFEDVTISACSFRNLDSAVLIGIYGRSWTITGNVIRSCRTGISMSNYSVAYGYEACREITITGNTLSDMHGADGDHPAIGLSNCSNAVISGNTVQGLSLMYPYIVRHCRFVRIDGSASTGAPDAIGLTIYRSRDIRVNDFMLRADNGARSAIAVSDDLGFPSRSITLLHLGIDGPVKDNLIVKDVFGEPVRIGPTDSDLGPAKINGSRYLFIDRPLIPRARPPAGSSGPRAPKKQP
jgi:hypothetical protein